VTDEEDGFGLVYPFVVCQSKGGPYDDSAFVAGCQFGQVAAEAKQIPKGQSRAWYVYPEIVAQLDLLAMHEGLHLTSEPWDEHPEEWALVTLRRPAPSTVVVP
jgi:hypothetical protein